MRKLKKIIVTTEKRMDRDFICEEFSLFKTKLEELFQEKENVNDVGGLTNTRQFIYFIYFSLSLLCRRSSMMVMIQRLMAHYI